MIFCAKDIQGKESRNETTYRAWVGMGQKEWENEACHREKGEVTVC